MAMAPQQVGIGIRRHFTRAGRRTPTTPSSGSVVTRASRTGRTAPTPSSRPTSSSRRPGRRTPPTSSPRSTSAGTLGTAERETSLRQVIDRVADTITEWGVQDGYFTDERGGARRSATSSSTILVTQRAAFNSPVWFNIGVKGVPQQGSACQPYDALVSTPEGLVPIGKLVEDNAVGTKVFDAHGITKIVADEGERSQGGAAHPHQGRHHARRHARPPRVAARRGERRASSSKRARCVPVTSSSGTAPSRGAPARSRPRDGRGRARGLAAVRRIRRPVRGHERVAHDRGDDGHRRRARLGAVGGRHRLRGAHRTSARSRRRTSRSTAVVCVSTANHLQPFVDRWYADDARHCDDGAGSSCSPRRCRWSRAYLRSLFQAEGYVSQRERSCVVGIDMVSEGIVRGVQQLLARFGIFARVRFKADTAHRPPRLLVARRSRTPATGVGSPTRSASSTRGRPTKLEAIVRHLRASCR